MDVESSSAGDRGRAAIDKARPILRRSCEACRASKGRCCPSIQDSKPCQKCAKDGKECVFLEPMPRSKRPKASRKRIAELEQKLDGLFALLSPDDQLAPGKEIIPSLSPSQGPSSFKVQPVPFQIPTGDFSNFMPGLSSLWVPFDDLQDVISNGIISVKEAERYLAYYRCHIQNFPFVIIPSHVSVDRLRRERPFVLLSILTMASKWNLQLQRCLETELRETLSRRVVVNGEKSLDLLQGLLLYLAWYHHYCCDPYHQQCYQLSQLLVAMVMELGISRHDRSSAVRLHGTPTGSSLDSTRPKSLPPETDEKRTFLGCFYLCSCLSLLYRMPSNLKYTAYLDEYCQALVKSNEFPSDSFLPHLIRLQRLAEEIKSIFDYNDWQQLSDLGAMRTDALVKSFTRQLDEMKECFPAEAWENQTIMMSYQTLKIYINEISMHATPPYPQVSTFGPGVNLTWYYSTTRTDALINCLEAAKEYMEFFLGQSQEQFYQNTMMELMKLAYTLLILGKFTSGVNSPHIDPMQLRQSANLSYYMDALITRIGEIVTSVTGMEVMHYMWQVGRIIGPFKQWYDKQINGGYFTTLEDSGIPSCHGLSALAALEFHPDDGQSQYRDQLPASPSMLEMPVLPDDQWADMLVTQPTSLDPQDF